MIATKMRKRKNSVILGVLFFAVVCYFVATLISLRTTVSAEEKSLEDLKISYQQQLDENAELEMIIENGNESDYLEKVAREQYGYAKPDERVYYDSTAS